MMNLQEQGFEYSPVKMTEQELRSRKYCMDCEKVVNTYWELAFCNKNPNGLSENLTEHGNKIDEMSTCEDDYCSPDTTEIEHSQINHEYIKTHEVDEKCSQCHQYMESMS